MISKQQQFLGEHRAELFAEWRDRAACIGTDPEAFFPEPGVGSAEREAAALRICWGCPVIEECRDWAFRSLDEYAVLGGLTARERKRLREKST